MYVFVRLASGHPSSAASIQKIKYIFGEKPSEEPDSMAAVAAEEEDSAPAVVANKAEADAATAEAGEEVKEGWLNCKVTAVDGKV